MRVTPAGTATLSLEVDCGQNQERMVLKIVRVGADVPELARRLKEGCRIQASGKLRFVGAGANTIEVLAEQVTIES